ncbi:TPA: hypothetical protein HA371_04985 [Candidatus Woesearchaeota archaeon]|nr:hypothetical protein [Candidatus Woesearchaeota archaeon]
MRSNNRFLNLIGQIRIYSLIDLIILLIAISSNSYQLAGAVLLHLSFILYLEKSHNHKYRIPFPKSLWVLLLIIGLILYKSYFAIGYLIFSFLYTRKNHPGLGVYSPIFRGIQSYFLVAGIIGILNPLSFLAGALFALRNFTGDLRDITKDKKEKLKTLPIVLGFNKDMKKIHLIFLLLTSFVWWYLSGISILWLALIYLIEIGTYNLTPR